MQYCYLGPAGYYSNHWSFTVCALALLAPIPAANQLHRPVPPSKQLESIVIECFARTHDGWSVDEVLLDDNRRTLFVRACATNARKQALHLASEVNAADVFCAALLHVRKRGGQLAGATKRARRAELDGILPMAEIAARQLQDEMEVNTDAILVSELARTKFDDFARRLAPEISSYLMRKAALQLRKSRRLEPELLSRVTDWKKTIAVHTAAELVENSELIPSRPGVYVFYDETGYLYIGQASDLRKRLLQHLQSSDREALASHLAGAQSDASVELHIFAPGSPAESVRVRRAYESELIRTRSPRLNIAP